MGRVYSSCELRATRVFASCDFAPWFVFFLVGLKGNQKENIGEPWFFSGVFQFAFFWFELNGEPKGKPKINFGGRFLKIDTQYGYMCVKLKNKGPRGFLVCQLITG